MAARRPRTLTRKRRTTRSSRRATSTYKRITKRKRTSIKRPSRKYLLNVTSKKKRDTMLCHTNVSTASQVGSPNYSANGAVITGGRTAIFTWAATARGFTTGSGHFADDIELASRARSNVYMRGLKERIKIVTNDGVPWLWRRICFTTRDARLRASTSGASTTFLPALTTTSTGYVRLVNQVSAGVAQDDLLWKGTYGRDWNDFITAPVDNRRLDIKYDKTITIRAGNADGSTREYNRWHPMNSMLYYDDEERGDEVQESLWSVTDKRGMGDFYVVDVIQSRDGASNSSQLVFRPDATLYWHEQ